MKRSASALEREKDERDERDEHPLALGSCVGVMYRDNSIRLATIVSTQSQCRDSAEKAAWNYYVHYKDFNRRMDEWVHADRIVYYPSQVQMQNNNLDTNTSSNSPQSTTGTGSPRGVQLSRNSSSSSISVSISTSISATTTPKVIHKATGNVAVDQVTSAANINVTSTDTGTGTAQTISDKNANFSTIDDLEHDEHEGLDRASILEHEEVTKIKNFTHVQLGRHRMECWYFSPLPQEYYNEGTGTADCLYFCEFTFRFFKSADELTRYQSRPGLPRHPPGNEIYRDSESQLSVFELDGTTEKIYCQNLCYFAKLFLDHKTLYWDVDPFLFYVICTYDERGFHPVGYFSKEKYSDVGYNLACILTFPSAQRKGYGRFIISLSYALSKKEEKLGSPEKPLSDLGAVSYKSYWASIILLTIKQFTGTSISIMDISIATSIMPDDVYGTLAMLGLIQEDNEGELSINASLELLDELIDKYPLGSLVIDEDRLQWTPYYIIDPKKDKWSVKYKKDGSDLFLLDSASAMSASDGDSYFQEGHYLDTDRDME